ncbi:MAG TPA: energy transducer TonB [Terracidiphilus sp.]|nr:energy transducer TonB [Terracidiphilus sp.]
MPTSQAPTEVTEPEGPEKLPAQVESSAPEAKVPGGFLGLPLNPKGSLETNGAGPSTLRGSRWVDYNTHELLEMISELEDERRWSRLREGFWIALLAHILFFSAITWIPTYVFKVPKVVDPFDVIKQRKDLAYLDLPPDALRETRPKVPPKPLPNRPLIDKKTLEELNRESPPTAPPPPAQAPEGPKPEASQPIPPNTQSPSQVEAPRPSPVPARPNFALGSQNPADQLRHDMENAMRNHGNQPDFGNAPSGGTSMHPGAGSGLQVLSDTQGVDFSNWLQRWHYITQQTWDPLIPDEVNPPILKSGMVAIRFKVLPNGQVIDMQLDGRSGDTGLDRAAWGAITGSSYPALPREFHGPYLELRAYFLYNEEPK